MVLLQDNCYVWSASFDCSIRLWRASDWSCLAVLTGHTHPVRSLEVTTDYVITGDYRGFIMVWRKDDVWSEVTKFRKTQLGRKEAAQVKNPRKFYQNLV